MMNGGSARQPNTPASRKISPTPQQDNQPAQDTATVERGASTFERAPSCSRHRVYLVKITDVAPSAASRAQRGAA